MPLLPLLFVVFLVLKLCNVIDWSWWYVTAPLWGVPVLMFGAAILAAVGGFLAWCVRPWK